MDKNLPSISSVYSRSGFPLVPTAAGISGRLRSAILGPAAGAGPGSQPVRAKAPLTGGGYPGVSQTAGQFAGTMQNWITRRLNRFSEEKEREIVTTRAEDLVVNDPHAASVVDSMSMNVIGTGLIPQATPHQDVLGWTDEETRDFQVQAEWEFSIWTREADAGGRMPFWLMQFLTTYSTLVHGEYLRVPVVLDTPHRTYSMALQCLHPSRLCTPRDLISSPRVRDGVQLTSYGAPAHYLIANPQNNFSARSVSTLSSGEYAVVPAWIGHRPGCFHGFVQKHEEQVRGISALAPGMKSFRDLHDYLDFEVVGAIVASSFPVWIETADPYGAAQGQQNSSGYKQISAGGIYYGKSGEKPHVLSPNRPGNTFPDFVERIIRTMGASVGLPYEVIAKDFSKTNYSSARAALLEAWRVFGFYQKWQVDMFCQPVWEMVMEEAWLRGRIRIPRGMDFYKNRQAICRARWIPPKRGHVDPLKEMQANIKGLQEDIVTLSEVAAEMGGDWESKIRQRGREREMQMENGRKDQ
jgi:lambda family phage portal protein